MVIFIKGPDAMPRPKLKDESKRRTSVSVSIRRDLQEIMKDSTEGISKTLENSFRSSYMVSKVLDKFYSSNYKEFKPEDFIEVIESIDDSMSIFTACFDDEDSSNEEGKDESYEEKLMSVIGYRHST